MWMIFCAFVILVIFIIGGLATSWDEARYEVVHRGAPALFIVGTLCFFGLPLFKITSLRLINLIERFLK
jgi:hypothetical protein